MAVVKTRQNYHPLTEAEWEYSARAGTTTAYLTGTTIDPKEVNFYNIWEGTLSVGQYASNEFGLRDMDGNVWERVQDCKVYDYTDAPTNGSSIEDSDD